MTIAEEIAWVEQWCADNPVEALQVYLDAYRNYFVLVKEKAKKNALLPPSDAIPNSRQPE